MSKQFYKPINIFLLLISIVLSSTTYANEYNYVSIDTEMEISADRYAKIFYDSHNVLWIGSSKGLFRYDGDSYEKIYGENNTVTPSLINDIIEDSFGNIWCGTNNGLYCVRNLSLQFESVPLDKSLNVFQKQNDILSIEYDAQNNVIICGTSAGLYFYNIEKNNVSHKKELQREIINDVLLDNNNILWVATWGNGLVSFDLDNGELFWHRIFNKVEKGGIANCIKTIYLSKDGTLLVSAWKSGVYCLNIDLPHAPKELRRISPDTYQSFKSSIVYDFVEDLHTGKIWVGTFDGVYSIDNILADDIEVERYSYMLPEAVSLNITPNKNLWVASKYGNIQRVDLNKKIFELSTHKENIQKLNNINTDNKGRILLVTRDNFIMAYSENSDKIESILNINEYKGLAAIKHAHINDVYFDKYDNLWLAGVYGGLYKYNIKSGKVLALSKLKGDRHLGDLRINKFYEDKSGNVWIQTNARLYRLEIRDTDDFSIHKKTLFLEDRELFNKIESLAIDSDGYAWIAIADFGFFRSTNTINDGQKLDLKPIYKDKNSILNAHTLLFSRDNTLWIGTNGEGLFRYTAAGGVVEASNQYKIPNLIYYDIIEDLNNDLWAITNYGLIQHKKEGDEFMHLRFGKYDGLICDEFATGAIHKINNDKFIVGGKRGFNIIKPAFVEHTTTHPIPMLTDNYLMQCVNNGKGHTLDYKNNNIIFKFVAADMIQPQDYIFAYKLDGFDKEWTYTLSNNNEAHYRNLPHGKYKFLVRASDHHGVWSETPLELDLRIKQNPLKTPLAIIIYILTALSIIYVIMHLYYSRKISLSKLKLKSLELENSDKINSFRMRFFTMVSHDLLSPLSILNTISDKWELLKDSNIDLERIIAQNSKYIHNKITKMLTFKSIDEGVMNVRVAKRDITQMLKNHQDSYTLIASNNSDVAFDYNIAPSLTGMIDANKVIEVMDNLVTNALKFTVQGRVSVNADQKIIDDFRYLNITIKDSGCGISKEVVQMLNKGLFQSEQANIGLRIVVDIIKAHRGSINYESIVGKGTTVVVAIPISESFYKEHELEKLEVISSSFAPQVGVETIEEHTKYEIEIQKDKTIILIDTDILFIQLYKTLLGGYYNVVSFLDLSQATEFIKSKGADIVIINYNMSNINFVRQLKELSSKTMVIALTSNDDSVVRTIAYGVGVDSVLNKPIDFDTLLVRIGSLLLKANNYTEVPELKESKLYEPHNDFINSARQVIFNHIEDSNFSVAELCNYFAISNSSLYRKFKTILDISPNEFIRQVKIEYACRILSTERDVNIYEVAYRSGFNDVSYFGTCFKKYTNMTPKKYQENISGESECASDE